MFDNINEIVAHHTLDMVPNPNDFYMHIHDKYEILYFIRGKAKFLVEGNEYELKPDDVLITRQSESHKLVVDTSEPYERVAIHIVPNAISSADSNLFAPFLNRQLGRMNLYSKSDFQNEHYISCLRAVAKHADMNSIQCFIAGNVVAMLGELYLAFVSKIDEIPRNKSNNISVKIVEYVNTHLFEDISLESVSEHFFLSVSQINRIFKKATGSTLWDYVMIKRLLAAREAIFTGMSATMACSRCGFSDYSSFYRAYKQKFGCSPKQSFKSKE